ncbi:MAG: hypothetical protein Q8O00_15015 [Holophaga sp.]|nr:hypothetical protein [Holophaga sp.]
MNIPPRLQWQSNHGYCGEASIQSIGLFYGAWISQGLIRKAAGGELLLGVNDQTALEKLHFTAEAWDTANQGKPQFIGFMSWLKSKLSNDVPCLLAIYLQGFPHADYDHIVPVVGVISAHPGQAGYDPQDILIYHNLFSSQPINRSFQSLPATREQCRYGMTLGGNIPENLCFGLAVTGLRDSNGITLPLSLAVDHPNEPNPILGEKASLLRGKITVSKLQPGQRYILLRFDKTAEVPTQGNATAFLRSPHSNRIDFLATDTLWSYADPKPIASEGATYYRCIPFPT